MKLFKLLLADLSATALVPHARLERIREKPFLQ
jgi:hypothetical protein